MLSFGGGAAPGPGFMREIEIQNTLVSGTHSEFPTLVYMSDPTLATVVNGGHMESADADDLLFWNETGLLTSPFWEIESYNPVTGEIWVWVQLDITDASKLVFYCTYGDSSIAGFQSVATSVWSANDYGVYHLDSNGSLSLNDSTINANHLTNNNGVTYSSSQLAGAGGASFVAASSQSLTKNAPLTTTQIDFSIRFWASVPAGNQEAMFVYNGRDWNGSGGAGWGVGIRQHASGGPGRGIVGLFGGVSWLDASSSVWPVDTRTRVTLTRDGSNARIRVDGIDTGFVFGAVPGVPDTGFNIGREDATQRWATATIDEVRVGYWISNDQDITEYQNQFDPAAFAVVGAETPL